jgi:hypothetical protein
VTSKLVREREASHSALDAEDVVVDREHVEVTGIGITSGGCLDGNLRVIDAREVASTGRLVLFGLERERVRVDTGVGRPGVVLEGLHLVEVLTRLLLHAVLPVEHKLHRFDGTNILFREFVRGERTTGTHLKERGTRHGSRDERVSSRDRGGVGLEDDVTVGSLVGEVPQTGTGNAGVEAPDQLLDGVVVREADLLGATIYEYGVNTGVLDLLDQVFVTLLGESLSLLRVEVDVVGVHLEGGPIGVDGEVGRQVEIQTDFVVLQRNQGKRQTGVAVEEEDQREEHLGTDRGGHLTPRSLLGLVQVKLRVQAPPLLVVLVNALTTDGKLNILDGAFGHPAGIGSGVIGGGRDTGLSLEFDIHVTDKVTVTGDSHGHAAGGRGGTVDGLLNVLHREVCVAAVNRLEEGDFRVTCEVDILGTVSYELHETTGHFVLLYYTPTFYFIREKHGTIFPHLT